MRASPTTTTTIIAAATVSGYDHRASLARDLAGDAFGAAFGRRLRAMIFPLALSIGAGGLPQAYMTLAPSAPGQDLRMIYGLTKD